tara:strand:+ start:741 stop:1139 length:399 start_codon:yes stop_codon:yes gene_type:complete
MEREYEKLKIIDRLYEIKNEINLIEQNIRMINSSSRTDYRITIEYNRLMNKYQRLNEELSTLLRKLFVIDPDNARLKDLGIYDANNFMDSRTISVGKKKKRKSKSRKNPKKSRNPKNPRRRKTKLKRKPKRK